MPSREAVGWVKSKQELKLRVKELLVEPQPVVAEAQKWLERINMHPVEKASERIWEKIEQIIDKN